MREEHSQARLSSMKHEAPAGEDDPGGETRSTPAQVPAAPGSRRWGRMFDYLNRAAKEFSRDDLSGLAAELSYRYFLALIPFLIFVAALGSFIAHTTGAQDPTASLMNLFGDRLPPDARSVLEGQVRGIVNSQSIGLLSLGILGALWASSSAMKALIKALNRAYEVPETRRFWQVTGLSLLMTLASAIGVIGSVAIAVATTAWGAGIARWFGAGHTFEVVVSIVRWPLMFLLLMFAVGVLYWLAPNEDVPLRFVTPGAALFVVAWLIATGAFSLYVSNFGSYNKTYGALGGVVVMMIWLYITNIVLLLGAEVNALVDAAEERRERPERAVEERSAG